MPKDSRTHRTASPPPAVAPSLSTCGSGASSASSHSTWILKMLRGIFTMCCHTDQRLDVLEQQMRISHHNMEIIHSQRDEPLHEFPNVPVFPPVEDPYASLTLS
jgi:hypothetical protein